MHTSQNQADHAFALKDTYVKGVKGEVDAGRLIPGIAQQPAVIQASGHIFLDEGKQGVINDGDPNLYFHRGGNTHKFNKPELGNPLPGGPGERRLDNMDPAEVPGMRNQFDQYQKQKQDEMYGTGNLARRAPVTQEEFDKKLLDNYDYRNKAPRNEPFRDPMTVKTLLG